MNQVTELMLDNLYIIAISLAVMLLVVYNKILQKKLINGKELGDIFPLFDLYFVMSVAVSALLLHVFSNRVISSEEFAIGKKVWNKDTSLMQKTGIYAGFYQAYYFSLKPKKICTQQRETKAYTGEEIKKEEGCIKIKLDPMGVWNNVKDFSEISSSNEQGEDNTSKIISHFWKESGGDVSKLPGYIKVVQDVPKK